VKLPRDLPFYPGTWLLGFAILALCWIYVDVWVAIGAFFGVMALQAVVVEIWSAARSRTQG
jgi:apolipoprotein N-acyltransferase